MLNNLDEQIRECLQRAEGCARKAAAQTDAFLRADFLRLEKNWLALAQSTELSQRIDRFASLNAAKPG